MLKLLKLEDLESLGMPRGVFSLPFFGLSIVWEPKEVAEDVRSRGESKTLFVCVFICMYVCMFVAEDVRSSGESKTLFVCVFIWMYVCMYVCAIGCAL